MVYSIRDLESAIFVAGDLLVGGIVIWLHLLLNYSSTALTFALWHSIKIELKENHIASASYIKII